MNQNETSTANLNLDFVTLNSTRLHPVIQVQIIPNAIFPHARPPLLKI
jgi:hypothetical protein